MTSCLILGASVGEDRGKIRVSGREHAKAIKAKRPKIKAMALAATGGPAEAFGILVGPGPLPGPVRASLERRERDRFCPFLMAPCPRPYPICSVLEAGRAIPICPHRLLEGQAVFRSLVPSLAGARPTVLRHIHPSGGSEALGWALFPAERPGAWLGVYTLTPLPAAESALAHAAHDLLAHGQLRADGYGMGFD